MKKAFLLFLVATCSLFAEESAKEVFYPAAETAAVVAPHSAGGAFLTSVFYLLFLAAMATVAWYVWRKKVIPNQGKAAFTTETIEIGATRSLGNRQFLVVAKIGGKELLLGVGPGFINKLETLKNEEASCEKSS